MQTVNYMPYIKDELKIVGRNSEIQQILTNLDFENEKINTKIIHIFGCKDVGKTAIALSASKFAHDRRFFPSGSYYIDLRNMN